jgi:hypothetical protein
MKRLLPLPGARLLVRRALLAQFETATTVGTVRDTTGAVVPRREGDAHQSF